MDIRKLQRAIVDGLEDVKAQDIRVFNTEHLSALFERVILASGASNRQTKALAASVRDRVKAAGMKAPRTEGEGNGEWIIVDCGAAVVHIMQPEIRDYYRLEEIWGDKPVAIKLAARAKGLPKAAPAAPQAPAPGAAKKAVAKKAPAKKVAAKTAAAKSPAKPAKASTARQSVAKPAAAGSAGARKTPVARTAGTKASVSRTVGVKKAPAKKAGTAAAKKTAAARRG